MGAEDKKSDNSRSEGGDQHATGGDILGLLDEGVEFRRCNIRKEFEGGIQRLGGPDGHDRQYDPAPFGGRKDGQAAKDENAA